MTESSSRSASSSNNVGRIGVVGSCTTDLVTYIERMPERGETIEAHSFAIGCGGKGANQAVAAACLGSAVMMVGRVGDDAFGRLTLENFRARGIDARHVAIVPGIPSGVAPIFVDPTGENRILIVNGANGTLMPGDVLELRDELAACAIVLLQLEIPLETVYATIALCAELGVPVMLNPAPALPALDLTRIGDVAYFVPNQTELALITGLPTERAADAERAARQVLAAGVGTVIVTLGAGGALLVTAAESRHVAAPVVRAIDTTGAGDAFIGAFADAIAGGFDTLAAIHAAVDYAADSVTRKGTQTSYAMRP